MAYKNEFGRCSGPCGQHRHIVNKRHNLCQTCNKQRIISRPPKQGQRQERMTKKKLAFNGNKNATSNMRFYLDVWDKFKIKECEECGMKLHLFNPAYISHILPKGAHPKMRTDLRNANLLCLTCHNTWEFGSRKSMKIYEANNQVVEALMKEYYADKRK